jgi:SAM-dependent methyltransferase
MQRYDARRLEEKLSIYGERSVAADYDQRWSGRGGRARDLRKQRAIGRALAELQGVDSVLDVPCGTGRMTEFVRGRELRYVGADVAFAMLEQARGKHEGARFVAASLAQLPFADASFDVVLCIRLMHLVRDGALRAAFLREARRVARKAVIVDYRQNRALRVWLGNARAAVGLRKRAPGALAPDAIEREIAAAGLRVAKFVPVRRVPYLSDKVVVLALRE